MPRDKDGGPAFPTPEYYDEKPVGIDHGMTLRDYLAAQALIGLVLKCQQAADAAGAAPGIAEDAYKLADAMLAERKR